MTVGTDLYDRDLYAWAMTSARLVREGCFEALDRRGDAFLCEAVDQPPRIE